VTGRCGRCRSWRPIHWHHVTGSGIDGRYLHPRLTFPLCVPCHDGMHAVLRGAGIDGDREGTPLLILARFCAWLSWMGEESGPFELTQTFVEELTIALEGPLAALMEAVLCG